MDKETELLSRLAVNHLHLSQFEPLRATLLALRTRNPDLAVAILQTIVANSGRFDYILWSASCPSPSLLAFLSTLELLQFDNSTSSTWRFDPETLRLRSEFLLLVQMLSDRVVKRTRKDIDFDSFEKEKEKDELNESESFDERVKLLDESGVLLGDVNSEFGDCVRVLDMVMELAVKRLEPNVNIKVNENVNVLIEEGELMCLRKVILEYADVFDALCWNIDKQVRSWESFDTDRAIVRPGDLLDEEDKGVLGLIQKSVQLAHLDAVKDCLKDGDEDGAVSRIRFLHLGYGVEEAEYRMVLEDLLKRVLSKRKENADTWLTMQEKLLLMYTEALSSSCMHLVQMIQVIQDELLLQEIETCRALDNNQIPPPLERFQRFVVELKPDVNLNDKSSALYMAVSFCIGDLYHYARVSGFHVLECLMNTALSAVKREQLQEASNILMLHPRLQPLVAAMGWDLLSGKTLERRKLMQLLWTSKSQVYRLEESSLYGNQSDEISCVEHLCDLLCYQLDLASFVARVNSGQSWNSKFSLLLSGKEQEAFGSDDSQLDPFVENFVLERLSAQSPLRVLFDVVPDIKFQDAIELISMQPIASDIAAWKRMQDIELMHMRYAVESTIFALGAMERTTSDERENRHQVALCHLKDIRNHLEAITSIPRKIFTVNLIISLLHMDDLSLNLTHCASPESPSACTWEHSDLDTSEGGNKMVVLFTGLLLDILHRNLPSTIAEEECASNDGISISGRQALEWRISIAKRFCEDWEWRLSILQRLFPLSDRQWSWKEALTVLRAAPSKLLNLCMQRAKYDIGEEAVHRFSLSAEDRATLELAEWVDSTFRRASV